MTAYTNEKIIHDLAGIAASTRTLSFAMGEMEMSEKIKNLMRGVDARITKLLADVQLAASMPKPEYDLVLIDDDPLVRSLWQYEADRRKQKLLAIASPDNVASAIESKTIPIFVDVDLGVESYGLIVAQHLYAAGFKNLHLTTGHKEESLRKLPFIRSVIGKDFPGDALSSNFIEE